MKDRTVALEPTASTRCVVLKWTKAAMFKTCQCVAREEEACRRQ